MAEYGLLGEIRIEKRTTSLTAAASISDIELEVDSAGDLAEDGGTLELNGVQLEYSSTVMGDTEDDPDVVVLVDPLAVAADVDDQVTPVIGGLAAEDWYAIVDLGGGDPAPVPLTFAQRQMWPEGSYDPPVPVMVSEDLQRLEDAPGRPGSVASRVEAWNEDEWTAAGDDTDSPGTLTYLPKPHSLMLFKNGLRLRNNQFTLVGRVATALAAEVTIKSTDNFSAYYDRDPAAEVVGVGGNPDIPGIELVGVNSSHGLPITEIALPANTQAGDLIVLASMATGNGTTDSRITDFSINGAGVLVGWGTEDGSGDPVAVAPTGTYKATCVAVFRGVAVADFDITQVTTNPAVLPVLPDGYAAVGILTCFNGFSNGPLDPDSTSDWARAIRSEDTNAHCSIETWESLVQSSTPAGSFNMGGTLSGATQTTLLLEEI